MKLNTHNDNCVKISNGDDYIIVRSQYHPKMGSPALLDIILRILKLSDISWSYDMDNDYYITTDNTTDKLFVDCDGNVLSIGVDDDDLWEYNNIDLYVVESTVNIISSIFGV